MVNFNQLVSDVRAAYNSGRTRDVKFRKQQLKALLKMYNEHEEEFCAALDKDLRKPRQEAMLMELNLLRDDIAHTLSNLDEWAKPELVSRSLVTMFDKPVIYHDPYGVVLVMGAWNYSVQLTLLPVQGAIAAGNCVVIKPSEHSQTVSQLIAKLVPQYLDEECYRVVEGGIPETTELLKEKFDHIFYTGSSAVGKIVRKAANENLTPTILELGGKSPVYLDDSVDFDVAVRRILWGKFVNAGQTCIAPDYLLCSKDVQEKFVAKAREVIKEFYGEDPKQSPDLCRIISDRHVQRLAGYLKEGTVAIGGEVDDKQKYVAPTILINLPHDSKVMEEEIFGPILPIVNVESAYDAIQYITNKERPLALYVFSLNKERVDLLLANVICGGSTVNDVIFHAAVPQLPFGGVGNSGMGNYHGKASFDAFTHNKSCLHRNYNSIADFIGRKRYPPYSESNMNFLSNMLKERWMPSMKYLPHVVCFGLGMVAMYAGSNIAKIKSSVSEVTSYIVK